MMAQSGKKLAERFGRGRTSTRSGSSALSSEASVEQRLTGEILAIDHGTKARVVQDVVAIGARLQALQQHLGFGRWLPWLSEHLHL
ncbi:MAG: DUF3102 domain-containing protein [Nannocystaceae bacterium]|nr:DUF3102 domain-containing protein [Nannocystaceae bacterium]